MKFQLKDFNVLLLISAILLVMFGTSMNFADVIHSTNYSLVFNDIMAIIFYSLSLILILKTFKEQFQFAKFLYVILSILIIFLTIISMTDIITRTF
jgi:hypothetical protein